VAATVIEATLRKAGHEVVPIVGESAKDAADRVAQAMPGLDTLVVCGGDGTVNLGVNAVAGTGVLLGIVAAGTGNDVARGLGLPVGDWPAAADVLVSALAEGGADHPRRRVVDAVRCTWGGESAWYAGVLGAGFDAVVNERANGWSWPRGRAKYPLAVVRELPVFQAREYVLDLDGETWRAPAMLVAVANGPSYGGGLQVCPDARFDDGLLDVLVVAPMSRTQLIRIFPKVYSGRHVTDPRVTIRRAGRVAISASGIVGYADGERIGPLPLTCEAVPGALTVLVPAQVAQPG
jgi:diacylglycerol kinase (ATP)